MKKSDFMLQVILELVKRDGADADIEKMCQFAYRTCNNLGNFETAYNETIFEHEGIDRNLPKMSEQEKDDIIEGAKKSYKKIYGISLDEVLESSSSVQLEGDMALGLSELSEEEIELRTELRHKTEEEINNFFTEIEKEIKTPEWKPENVKVNDYVGFHYEGHRDQEGQVTFISKKIVPELSIRTKDGKSWKVSRDNIFDPSLLLEK